MKKKTRQIRLTESEAKVLMMSMEMAVRVYGTPESRKYEKAFFSVVEKLDAAFEMGVLDDAAR